MIASFQYFVRLCAPCFLPKTWNERFPYPFTLAKGLAPTSPRIATIQPHIARLLSRKSNSPPHILRPHSPQTAVNAHINTAEAHLPLATA
jgi:hypothetical protein